MTKRIFFSLAILILLSLDVYAGGRSDVPDQAPEDSRLSNRGVRIATGDPAGTYHSFGSFLVPVLARETRMQFSVIPTHGSIENIEMISSGRTELAIVQNDIADHAWKEAHLFQGNKNTDFAAVAALYTEVCHIVADRASGIRTISDLKGRRVSIGDHGSGTEINARQILQAYGMTLDDIQEQHLGFSASVAAINSRRIDAFFCVAGAPTPAIAQLAEGRDVVFLEIDDAHAEQLVQYDPYYTRHTIAPWTYRGQNVGVRTLALKATLIASWNLPDDVVYLLTKTIFENSAEIASAHAAGTELSVAFADDHVGVTIPFHPGAGRYYKEIERFPVIPLPRKRQD